MLLQRQNAFGAFDRSVGAAVVDQNDAPRAHVCRSTDARQSTMLSASFSAGMTTSTVASRQSSAGVGRVGSGPRRRPLRLRIVLGLKMK